LGADGEVTVDVARQAFADLFGPIGDVVPSGTPSPAAIDPSGVLAWIEAVWAQLTPQEQADAQAVLDTYTDPFAESAALGLRRGAGASEPRICTLIEVGQPWPPDELPANQVVAERTVAIYRSLEAHLGRSGPPRLAVCAQRNAALDYPIVRFGGLGTADPAAPVDHCNVYYPLDLAVSDDDELTARLAMLMSRCFRATSPGATLGAVGEPGGAWYVEGALVWAAASVAEEVAGTTGGGYDETWDQYLESPAVPLISRLWDAIGFFAQVEQADGAMWGRWDEVTHSVDSSEAFIEAWGLGRIHDVWASGYLRDGTRGPDWDITGPGITQTRYEPDELEIANGATVVLVAAAYTPALATVSTDADVIAFKRVGRLRVTDGFVDEVGIEDQMRCTRADGDCRCPDQPDQEPPEPLGSDFVVAITNGSEAGEVAMVGLSLDELCHPEPAAGLLAMPDPCALVTQAEADAVSGFATRPMQLPLAVDEFPELGTGVMCNYLAADTPADAFAGVAVVRVTVIDLGADGGARYAAWKARMAGIVSGSVEGLGEENFYFSPGAGDVALLYLRQQNLFIAISALVPNGLQQATHLAELALSRL
jgi:hypothetical protein